MPPPPYDSRRGRVVLITGGAQFGVTIHTRELQVAPTPTWAAHGAGSAGSPHLRPATGSLPAIGATFVMQLSNLSAAPGQALVERRVDPVEDAERGGLDLEHRETAATATRCLVAVR